MGMHLAFCQDVTKWLLAYLDSVVLHLCTQLQLKHHLFSQGGVCTMLAVARSLTFGVVKEEGGDDKLADEGFCLAMAKTEDFVGQLMEEKGDATQSQQAKLLLKEVFKDRIKVFGVCAGKDGQEDLLALGLHFADRHFTVPQSTTLQRSEEDPLPETLRRRLQKVIYGFPPQHHVPAVFRDYAESVRRMLQRILDKRLQSATRSRFFSFLEKLALLSSSGQVADIETLEKCLKSKEGLMHIMQASGIEFGLNDLWAAAWDQLCADKGVSKSTRVVVGEDLKLQDATEGNPLQDLEGMIDKACKYVATLHEDHPARVEFERLCNDAKKAEEKAEADNKKVTDGDPLYSLRLLLNLGAAMFRGGVATANWASQKHGLAILTYPSKLVGDEEWVGLLQNWCFLGVSAAGSEENYNVVGICELYKQQFLISCILAFGTCSSCWFGVGAALSFVTFAS